MESNKFDEKVRREAERIGVSLSELARRVGTTQPHLHRWLTKGPPRWDYLLSLAKELKVSVEYLIDDAIPTGHREPGPDPAEVKLLDVARAVGLDVAYRRVIAAPEPGRAFDRDWGGSPVGNHGGG